jgi:membrane-bound lytic murein transglycosylase B
VDDQVRRLCRDVMREIDDFGTIQRALGVSFDEIAAIRNDLAARKNALQEQQQEEQDLLQLQVLENNNLKQAEKDKQVLVSAAKGQEKIYQKVIAEKKQTAAQIRAALFALRDTKSVSFGDMYNYAKEASTKTGVRPAIILAILTEESNLGQNVGSGSWRVDMNPTRDAPIFQEICAQLGLDPDSQKVSKKPWYGWGGAMGPAQFIPSTWKQYASRISDMTGQNPPNPWDPRTATFATAILMMDNGADSQTPQSERLAALRYLAGWKNASKAAYAFYGNDVMALAQKIQAQIDILGS